jgi:hypothetical protein
MALPSTGPISALDVANEIGMSRVNFNWGSPESISLALFEEFPAQNSASVSASQWLGSSWIFTKSVNLLSQTQTTNYTFDMNSAAIIRGRTAFVVTVPRSTYIFSRFTTTAALTIAGGQAYNNTYWKDSFVMDVAGALLGKGGTGGSQSNDPLFRNGARGGPALRFETNVYVPCSVNISVTNGTPGYICGGGGGGAASGQTSLVSIASGGGGGGAGFGIGGGPNPVTTIPTPTPSFGPPQGDTPDNRKYSGGMGGTILPGDNLINPVGSLYSSAGAGAWGGQFVILGSADAGGVGGQQNNAGPNTGYAGTGTKQGAAGGGGWGASGGNCQNSNFVAGAVLARGGAGGSAIEKNGRIVNVTIVTGARVWGDVTI